MRMPVSQQPRLVQMISACAAVLTSNAAITSSPGFIISLLLKWAAHECGTRSLPASIPTRCCARLLVALLPQWDLLIFAKYLFVRARTVVPRRPSQRHGCLGAVPVTQDRGRRLLGR